MSERETITCEHCHMVQFRTKADLCRRCKESTAPPVPEPVFEIALVPFVLLEGHSVDLMRATAVVLAARRGTTSQARIARKMGVGRTYISKAENGKAMPVLDTLAKFAQAFRIPLWVLVKEIETTQALLAAAEKENGSKEAR